jgi:hypothetical protein
MASAYVRDQSGEFPFSGFMLVDTARSARCLFYDGAPLTRFIVEQLPLYLHRSYALLRELDKQVTG